MDGNDVGSRARWIAALVLLAAIWGGSIPATKLALAEYPPLSLTALRYLAAAPFFVLLLIGSPLPRLRDIAAMATLGALGIAVGQVFQALGVDRTSASVATVISATIPIFIVLLAAVQLRQPIRSRSALGLAAAFAGVALLAAGDPSRLAERLHGHGVLGDALMLVSSVAIALYYVLSVRLVRRYSARIVASWTSIAGAVAMTPILAGEASALPSRPSVLGIAMILYLALLVTVLGVWLWMRALEHLPARIAASLQYLQPIVGVAASAVLLGDRLDAWFAAGTGLVFVGIALSTIEPRPPAATGSREAVTAEVAADGDRAIRRACMQPITG